MGCTVRLCLKRKKVGRNTNKDNKIKTKHSKNKNREKVTNSKGNYMKIDGTRILKKSGEVVQASSPTYSGGGDQED
jgi:hypothetical protein